MKTQDLNAEAQVAPAVRRKLVVKPQKDIAADIFRRKQIVEIIGKLGEMITALMPLAIFLCCFGLAIYTGMHASIETVAASAVFYVFALLFLLLMTKRRMLVEEE